MLKPVDPKSSIVEAIANDDIAGLLERGKSVAFDRIAGFAAEQVYSNHEFFDRWSNSTRLISFAEKFGLTYLDLVDPLMTKAGGEKIRLGENLKYASLPNFDRRTEILANLDNEIAQVRQKFLGVALRPEQIQGLFMMQLKFSESLLKTCDQVLECFPDLNPAGDKTGKKVCLFGLSGSGKTWLARELEKAYPDKVVVLDSDQFRYNIFAAKLKAVEPRLDNKTLDQLIHSPMISSPMYTMIGLISSELTRRGYVVVQTAVSPHVDAEHNFYVNHLDNIDPRNLPVVNNPREVDPAVRSVVAILTKNIKQRCQNGQTYNWDNATLITDVRSMQPVSVNVPDRVLFNQIATIQGVFDPKLRKNGAANIDTSDVRVLQNSRTRSSSDLVAELAKAMGL